MSLLSAIMLIIYWFLAFNVFYLLLFGISGRFLKRKRVMDTVKKRRIAVLIPSYKEDSIIVNTAVKAVAHDYPRDCFDIFIIADQLQEETVLKLSVLDLKVIPVSFDKSTKAKSLKYTLRGLPDGVYDVLMILDADNQMEKGCLLKTNDAFERGYKMVQLHRTAKNKNTPTAILDAISEEINNHIFRKGHRALGLSSALIGSGMAFDFAIFKNMMLEDDEIDENPGEDREIYLKMLERGYVCEYIDDAHVYDEKVQSGVVLERQRTRWISAQLQYAKRFWISELKKTMTTNVHYFDNALQTLLLPRVTLLVVITVFSVSSLLLWLFFESHPVPDPASWWVLLLLCVFSFLISIIGRFSIGELKTALTGLPLTVFAHLKAFAKSSPDQDEFIHTPKNFVDE